MIATDVAPVWMVLVSALHMTARRQDAFRSIHSGQRARVTGRCLTIVTQMDSAILSGALQASVPLQVGSVKRVFVFQA